jgi:hypothetical protein
VAGDHFIFYAFVVEVNCMLCVVAAELKQVFDYELLILAPSDFQPSFLQLLGGRPFDRICVKQVKHFFVVDLKKRAVNLNRLCFALLSLFKYFSNCSHSQSDVTKSCINVDFTRALIALGLLVLVSLHSVGFSRASLAIREDSCVVAFNDFINEAFYL